MRIFIHNFHHFSTSDKITRFFLELNSNYSEYEIGLLLRYASDSRMLSLFVLNIYLEQLNS